MSTRDAAGLLAELDCLRRRYAADANPIDAWLAIGTLTKWNRDGLARGENPYPMPEWLNDYLLRSADKINRLSSGIAPDDDRPVLSLIETGEIGYLRKVAQSDGATGERTRDARVTHVPAALGFVRTGWNAFQRHDRAAADAFLLRIVDDPELADNPALRARAWTVVASTLRKQEGVTLAAVRNRISKARKARRKLDAITKPLSQFDD